MRPIREGRLRRLKREADDLARKPRKSESDRAREADINAQFERDMRETDQQPAPFSKGE
jgi:hypothetical protein